MSAARLRIAAMVFVALVGCAMKKRAPATAEAMPPQGAAQLDALASAQAELAANAAELQSLGVVLAVGPRAANDELGSASKREENRRDEKDDAEPEVPAAEPDPGPAQPSKPVTTTPTRPAEPKPTSVKPADSRKASESTPCQRICALATVACDLSKRICELADDHEGDARYEDACWNAERQCDEASDACSDCTAC